MSTFCTSGKLWETGFTLICYKYDKESQNDIPDKESQSDISDKESQSDIAVKESQSGIPDKESQSDIPVKESQSGIPDKESRSDIPDKESQIDIPLQFFFPICFLTFCNSHRVGSVISVVAFWQFAIAI